MPATLLTGSFYSARRGGHVPGDVRDAFCEALEAFVSWNDGEEEPTVELRERQVPISRIFGLLWNCSDILPSFAWSDVIDLGADDEIKRRTYAAVARWVKANWPAVR
jgi:hypothetical protein